MRVKNLFALILAVLLFGLGGIISPPAEAATFTVNAAADAVDAIPGDGLCQTATPAQCTLRAAIMEANALPGTDTIMLPAGTYVLSLTGAGENNAASGDLDINSNLIIRGEGAAIIDGNATDRVFQIIGPVTAELVGLTIRNGFFGFGGAIYNNGGALSLTNCIVTANFADPGNGGGIYNDATGTLIAVGTAFDANIASGNGGAVYNEGIFQSEANVFSANAGLNGGGIYNADSGQLTVNQSSFEVNLSDITEPITNGGAGIFNNGLLLVENSVFFQNDGGHGGALYHNQTGSLNTLARLTNVTIGENIAAGNGGGIYNLNQNAEGLLLVNVTLNQNEATLGGGLYNAGQASLLNTILANNELGNCSGSVTSLGNNLETGNTCGFGATGDLTGTDPQLLNLAANGGPTLTYALDPNSPAIDAGNSTLPTFTTDQRLYPRVAPFDIGAYEFGAEANPTADLAITKTVSQASVLIGTPFSYTITVTNLGPSQATGITISDTLPPGVTLVSLWASQGTCNGTDPITCNLGDLNPTTHSAATVILNVIAPGTVGLISNAATVTAGNEPDPNLNNNSDPVNTTIINAFPLPSLASIDPTSTLPGGPAFTLTVNGSNFFPESIVRWNGTALVTTFVNNTQLTAAITQADIATVGTASVTVFNPAPGGGESPPRTFTISNTPVPIQLFLPLILNASPHS